jgi:hypothetical protein
MSALKKRFFVFVFIIFTKLCFGQGYLLHNEELIFSFETKSGKKMVLAKDKQNEYIIYRFGTPKKIELEYPEKDKTSWEKFTYSHYFRGGGIQNAGMEIMAVYFRINNFEYMIYEDYYSENEYYGLGVLVTDLTSNKEYDIKGSNKSKKGSFLELRESDLIKIDDKRAR